MRTVVRTPQIVAETAYDRIRASRNPAGAIAVAPRIEDCGQARFGPTARLLTSTRCPKDSIEKEDDPMFPRVALLALLLALATVFAVPAGASPRGTNGQIAFARFNPDLGDTQVYVVNPDGTGQRLVQGPTDTGEGPRWFPDGTHIATAGSSFGGVSTIINPDDGTFRVVPDQNPGLFNGCGSPSPDGTLLLCETFSEDGSQNGIHTIRSSDGGGLTQITSNPGGDDIPGDWSPNGKRIVFQRYDSNGNEIVFSVHLTPDVHSSIWVVHADGTGLHEINVQPASACGGANDDPDAQGCNSPTWSPDGTKIAFVRSHSNDVDGEIYTVNADGTGLTQITNAPGSVGPDWGT